MVYVFWEKKQHAVIIWKLKLAALAMFKNSGSSLRAWIELVLAFFFLKVFEREFWIDYKNERSEDYPR